LPQLAFQVVVDPTLRLRVVEWFVVGVPALALWMVAAHATHGAALDVGARRQGGRSQRKRALRFGLYACGWDLMTGPLGAIWILTTRGMKAASELLGLSMRVPGKASNALLKGVYGLSEEEASRAQKPGTVAAVALAVLSAFGVLLVIALA